MKHTIYLTSGQTAEVVADRWRSDGADNIYFERDGNDVAQFRKDFVAGISYVEFEPNKSGRLNVLFGKGQEVDTPIDWATGASSGWKK